MTAGEKQGLAGFRPRTREFHWRPGVALRAFAPVPKFRAAELASLKRPRPQLDFGTGAQPRPQLENREVPCDGAQLKAKTKAWLDPFFAWIPI